MAIMSQNFNSRGFTLIELLLSIGLIGILTGIGAPILGRAQTKNDLDTAVSSFVSSVRRAEILSQAVDSDIGWGVKLDSTSITLFKGNTFATRNSGFDEVFSVPTTITFSGTSEIDISKFTGYPASTASTTFTSTIYSDSVTVTVNSRGMVSY